MGFIKTKHQTGFLGSNLYFKRILKQTTRNLIFGSLCLLFALAVVWAMYNASHISSGPGYYLSLVKTYGPAVVIFWFALDYLPSATTEEVQVEDKPTTVPDVEGAVLDESEDDPYIFSGSCSPHDARILLPLLEKESVRFQIDAGTEMGRQMSFLGKQSISFTPIQIFIHTEDKEKADKIFAKSGIEFGAV
jgi:hypothetical protein